MLKRSYWFLCDIWGKVSVSYISPSGNYYHGVWQSLLVQIHSFIWHDTGVHLNSNLTGKIKILFWCSQHIFNVFKVSLSQRTYQTIDVPLRKRNALQFCSNRDSYSNILPATVHSHLSLSIGLWSEFYRFMKTRQHNITKQTPISPIIRKVRNTFAYY